MSVPGSGQFRGPTPAQPYYDINAASLQIPEGYAYASTTTNGHTMVNVQPVRDPNTSIAQVPISVGPVGVPLYQFAPGYGQPISYQYPGYQRYVAPHMPPVQQSQPASKPALPRKKNLLNIVNPNTQESIFVGGSSEAKGAPSTESVVDKKEASPVPVVSVPQPISESSRTSSDDIRCQFTQTVADRFKEATLLAQTDKTAIVTEKNDNAIENQQQPVKTLKEEVSVETNSATASKEQTPVIERIETDKKSASGSLSREESEAPASFSEPESAPTIVVEQAAPETSESKEEEPKSEPKETVEDKAVLLKDYEEKVEEYFNNEEHIKNIRESVYPRDFIKLLREIIKKFKTAECPLSEEDLRKKEIDRGTMPKPPSVSINKSKYSTNRVDNFNPSWNTNKVKYQGRFSDNRPKKQSQQRTQIVGRQSIQRQQVKKLERSSNAWVPTSQQKGQESAADRIEKVKKEIRGLLNKITPSTYAELSLEFINKKVWQDAETLPTVVELIFTKAVEEPTFVGIYSDLCKIQHEAESKNSPSSREFYQAVVRKCQNIFEGTVETPTQVSIRKIKEQLESEEDPKKKQFLKEEVDELNGKQKRYMLGTIKFISHLYRIKFLNWKIIHFCIVRLLKTAEESMNDLDIEYCINLLETVGSFMEANERVNLNKFVDYVSEFKSKVTNRVKFMIMGLEDSRNKNWTQKDQGPKTKEEVKTEVLKEEAQNKRERESYEKKPYAGRPSGQQAYGGRPSKDKTDRKVNAVVNSSNAGGKDIRKELKLDNCDNPAELRPQRAARKPVAAKSDEWTVVKP